MKINAGKRSIQITWIVSINMKVLNDLINQWAKEKGIFENGHPFAQAMKTLEEASELVEATYNQSPEDMKDAIGDIYVTMQIQCAMNGFDMEDCVRDVYKVISARTGTMIDGKFVKDQ
jgi:NTP pyrophosphatase (non-canonical NTP hydrolase)